MAKSKKTAKKNNQLPLVIAAAVIAVAAIVAISRPTGGRESAEGQIINEGQSLTIRTDQVTEEASFYPIQVDGVDMEVLAIRDSDGNIRTAFNTCQSCYTSGQGYYEADGTELVCHNCGFRFTADQVQVRSGGGCNPYPIFSENKTETEDEISIAYDFLRASNTIFANWNK